MSDEIETGQASPGASHAFSLETAFSHLPYGVALFDTGLKLIAANRAYGEKLLLPPELVAPGTALEAILLFMGGRGDLGPGDPAALASARIAYIKGQPTTLTRRMSVFGRHLEIHTSRTATGEMVISFTDVTDRAQAEAALAEMNHTLEERVHERTRALSRLNAELERARAKADAANLDKTQFLAAASHDLLQPLNAARLYTSTLYERSRGTALASLAESIDASLGAVEDIMSALLDISRMDSGALKVSMAQFDIRELLRKIEIEFRPQAEEKSIRLDVVATSRVVHSDRMLLARVVQNLVSNAIKYTKPGGRVLVGGRIRGNTVRVDVIDTGIGIDLHQHHLIFTEFSRLEQGARIAPGLGLGLSIVKRIVSALDHAIELDSRVGKGSRFSVFVPRVMGVPAAPEPEPPAPPPVDASLAGLNVLCVDNESAILSAMETLLGGWGCTVKTATSLRQIAQEGMIEGWVPDLVLMDYHLDQTSGLDAIEWLRQQVGGHLPAALLTADRSHQVRALADNRGIPILPKPIKPAALRALLNQVSKQR